MKELTYAQQAQLFGALAHPARLRILDILADGEACVCHLSAALHHRQAYVSQQLARLKEAELIVDKKDGLYVYYCLADTGIADLLRAARQTAARLANEESPVEPEPPPHGGKKCPCPRCQDGSARAANQNPTLTP